MLQEDRAGGQGERDVRLTASPSPLPRPVQALDYALPGVGTPAAPDVRPGRLTTIAVLSIVLGALGMIANGFASVVWYAGFSGVQAQAPQEKRATLIAAPDDLRPYTGDVTGPRGLDRAGRQAARAAVEVRDTSFSDDHAAMLDRLLAEVGRDAFDPSASGAVSVAPMPSTSGAAASAGTAYRIQTSTGTIEVGRVFADWTPRGRTEPVVRAVRNVMYENGQPARYGAVAAAEALDVARHSARGQLNALQAAVILREIRAVPPQSRQDGVFEQIPVRAVATPTGTIQFALGGRGLWIFKDGRTADQGQARFEPDPTTGRPVGRSASPTVASRSRVFLSVSNVLLLACVECAYSFLVAGLLTVAGVRVFAGSPKALSGHALYAVLKVVGCAASAFILVAFLLGAGAALRGGVPQLLRSQAALFAMALLQLAYPAIVLVVLATADVRRFAAAKGWGYGLFSGRSWRTFWRALGTAPGRRAVFAAATTAALLAAAHAWCAAAGPGADRSWHYVGAAVTALAAASCAGRLFFPVAAAPARATVAALVLASFALLSQGTQAQDATTRPSKAPIIVRLGRPETPAVVPLKNAATKVPIERPDVIDTLVTRAVRREDAARFHAVRELYALGEPGRAAALQLVARADRPLRGNLLQAIGQSWDFKALKLGDASLAAALDAAPALCDTIQDHTAYGKDAAIALVERAGARPRTLDACIALLRSDVPDVRGRGAALILAADTKLRDEAVARLTHLLDTATPVNRFANPVGEVAVRALAELGPVAAPALLRATRAPWPGVRVMSITALKDLPPSPEILTRAGELLGDRDAMVRSIAANLVVRRGGPASRDAMIDHLFDSFECQTAVANAMPAVRKWIDHARVESYGSDPSAVRAAAQRAIKAVSAGADPEAQLLAVLDDRSPAARRWAARGLLDGDWIRHAGVVEQARVNACVYPLGVAGPSTDYGPWTVPAPAELAAIAEQAETPLGPVVWFMTAGAIAFFGYLFRSLTFELAESERHRRRKNSPPKAGPNGRNDNRPLAA